MNRFIIKKFKLCYRNSMIAGNPVCKSFPAYGIFDRLWETDHTNCGVGFHGYEQAKHGTYRGYAPEFRAVFLDEDIAKKIASHMNELEKLLSSPASIGFSRIDHKYNPCLDSSFKLEVTSFSRS